MRPWNDAADPAAERAADALTHPSEVLGVDPSAQTREAHTRSEVAASRRAAIMLGLCAECWGDMLPTAGGVLQCVNPDCPDGPEGGLAP